MAKSLKKLVFEKINWTSTVKNFNRLSKVNKLGMLTAIGNQVAAGKLGNTAYPIGPEDLERFPPWVWPYIMADDRLAVVYIRGPKKKGVLDVKSYAQELITTAASDKNVKFDRFASNGVQHLMVNTSSIQFEILVMPK